MKNLPSSLFWVINHPNNKNKLFSTVLRLILWKFNQLFLKIPIVVEMGWGVKFKCYPNSSWGGLVMYTKLPEFYEMKFIKRLIRTADIAIDVGSNMGSYSLICASQMRTGKVFAFEPSKVAYKGLLENIHINNLRDKIIPFNTAISDKEAILPFTNESTSETSHISYGQVSSSSKIKSFSLDKFVGRQQIKKIRFIKIDVEGYEFNVLKGATKILTSGMVDYLLVEINRNSLSYGINPSETIGLLKSYGYKTFCFRDSPRLYPVTKFTYKKAINVVAIGRNVRI